MSDYTRANPAVLRKLRRRLIPVDAPDESICRENSAPALPADFNSSGVGILSVPSGA